MNIINRLVPVLDTIRGSVAKVVGDHQFSVFVVVRTWSGSRVGDGYITSEIETEITPIPRSEHVHKYSAQPYGRQDETTIIVTEISLRYVELDLAPIPAANQQVFYRLKDAQNQQIEQDEYVLSGPPDPDRTNNIGWVLKFKRAQEV